MIEFSLFNSGFYLHHDIWRDGVHFMDSFCVCCNFSHQLSFGGSRGLKPTVLSKTYKGWHLLHQSVIILCLFMFFCSPGISESSAARGQCRRLFQSLLYPSQQQCDQSGNIILQTGGVGGQDHLSQIFSSRTHCFFFKVMQIAILTFYSLANFHG
jgi:hypothetical protein